ncbi:hypothetical protein MMC26_004900 [Xylographa opegraphella]|nr:hypothetical protein [Xylographa opegraphella]
MTPPIHISMATPSDMDAIATTISRAMAADLIDVFQFGTNHERAMATKRALCRATYPASLQDPATRVFKATLRNDEGDGPVVVAFASLTFYSGERPPQLPPSNGGERGFPEGMDAAFCGMYYARMAEARWGAVEGRRHVEGEVVLPSCFTFAVPASLTTRPPSFPAWSALHVLPEYQRQGIGTALLAWGFETFGLERELVYIGTQMRGRNLYRRYGWVDAGFVDVDLREWGGQLRGYGIHRSPVLLREPGRFVRVEGVVDE